MRLLIQKVKNLKIYQNKKLILDFSSDNFCYLIYVSLEKGDENKILEEIIKKIENLEIIDINGKFNHSLKEIKPKIVFVSQITLSADFVKGRINFNRSLEFSKAEKIFNQFFALWLKLGYNVFKTDFGAFLEIESTNLGPVNFFIFN
ncbi:MAG: hypothetical protein KatS3mg093_073 [Candidatus Parcubacteria bacterium]|nr:MAG: hypothetical protein KatS3mg093_073 [Candidatus Parcubacteria bacterium]